LPPLASNSLRLLEFCIAAEILGSNQCGETVRKSLF
jgi:hypothetical protein